VFDQIFTCGLFGWFPCWDFKNPDPARQLRFQQFRVIERFCVKGSPSAVIVGHSSNDLEIFIERSWRATILQFSALRKLINTFPFLPRNSGRGDPTSVKSDPANIIGGSEKFTNLNVACALIVPTGTNWTTSIIFEKVRKSFKDLNCLQSNLYV